MVSKDGGVKPAGSLVRGCVFFVWVLFSTLLYGLACICFAPFSRKTAWQIGDRWCRHLLAVGGVRLKVTGMEKLKPDGKYMFVSNHLSSLDIPILIATLPFHLVFMAKKELFYIPVFGQSIAAVGHIPVDRSNARKARESITHAVKRIKTEPISLILFPEGTRSVTGAIGEFKHASFTLAKEAAVDLVPVLIQGAQNLLPKNSKLIHPGEVEVVIGEPIAASATSACDKREISTMVRLAMVAMKAETPAS